MRKKLCYWLCFVFVIPFILTGFAFYLTKLALHTGYGCGKEFEPYFVYAARHSKAAVRKEFEKWVS